MPDLAIAVRIEHREPFLAEVATVARGGLHGFTINFYIRLILDDGDVRATVITEPIAIRLFKASVKEARQASAAIKEYAQREVDRLPANYALARFADILTDLSRQN